MIYEEYILIALCIPVLLSLIFIKGETRHILAYFITGMGLCLLSSYLNVFFISYLNVEVKDAVVCITPLIEEAVQSIPVLICVYVFGIKGKNILECSVMIGIGFAVFENVYYLIVNNNLTLVFVLIRAFSTGVMHVLCSLFFGYGIIGINSKYDISWITIPGLYAMDSVFHAMFNLLVGAPGNARYAGYLMPVFMAVMLKIMGILFKKARENEKIRRFGESF